MNREKLKQEIKSEILSEILRDYLLIPKQADPTKIMLTLESVFDFICTRRNINPEKAKQPKRVTQTVMARYIYFYVTKKYFNANVSLAQIGSICSKDHSSVHAGVNKIEELLSYDKALNSEINLLIDALHEAFGDYITPVSPKLKIAQ